MKRLTFICRQLLVIFLLVAVAACSKKTAGYTQVIPADTPLLFAFDINSLVKKSGVDSNSPMVREMMGGLENVLGAEEFSYVSELMRDPSSAGVSLSDPVYMYMDIETEQVTIVFRVTDEGKVKNLLRTLETRGDIEALTSSGGINSTVLGGSLVCAFNGDALVLSGTGNPRETERIREQVFAQMKQSESASIRGKKAFEKMSARKGDMQMLVEILPLLKLTNPEIVDLLPAGNPAEAMTVLGSFVFEKGRMQLTAETYVSDPALRKMYESQQKGMGTIKNTHIERFPLSSLFYVSMNVKGKELYKLMAENEQSREYIEMYGGLVDLENIIGSLDGDISLGLTGLSMMKMSPEILLLAEVRNDAILEALLQLEGLIGMQPGMDLQQTGDQAYVLKTRQGNFHFGMEKNTLYLTTDGKLLKNKPSQSLKEGTWVASAKKGPVFMVANVDNVLELPAFRFAASLGGGSMKQMFELASKFSYVELYSPSPEITEFNIYLNDKDENSLKVLVDALFLMADHF